MNTKTEHNILNEKKIKLGEKEKNNRKRKVTKGT